MILLDALITWLHLVCTSVWIGGFIFFGIIVSSIFNYVSTSVEQRTIFIVRLGRRFNRIALPSLAILIITGIYNSQILLSKPDLLTQSNYGIILLIKILLVVTVVIVYSIYFKILNDVSTSALRKDAKTEYISALSSKMTKISRVILGLLITTLLLSALLDSGAVM
jgi:copper resistance protein D